MLTVIVIRGDSNRRTLWPFIMILVVVYMINMLNNSNKQTVCRMSIDRIAVDYLCV